MEIPQIVIGDDFKDDNYIDKVKIKSIIKEVENYDGKSIDFLPFVANLDDELKELTNNSMGVRIWVGFDEVLHCIVVYPNMEFKKLLE